MKIELSKKPRGPTIIQGFPGFGLVGMIATEYLVHQLGAEEIGTIWSKELPPIVAVHDNKLIQPLQIFFDKKNNLVIVQGLAAAHGSEWDISAAMVELSKMLKAKEIISLEGVAGKNAEESNVYFYTNNVKNRNSLLKKLSQMKSGVIVGVTGSLLVTANEQVNATCLFAETFSGLPDSKAASNLIKALDAYLGLKIDYKPLLKQAERFEGKLKGLLEQSKFAMKEKASRQNELNYFG